MGLFDMLRARSGHRPVQLIGRIADEPQLATHDGVKYMVFHLEEGSGKEFRLKMLPTTPKRRRGERVDLTYHDDAAGIAWVDAMTAAPDADATRRRNQEYLASIEASRRRTGS
ncbi:MAG TPA: hypothetical protein VKT83_10975 [bacterium]|nr:hypothetical protein [bacterium]